MKRLLTLAYNTDYDTEGFIVSSEGAPNNAFSPSTHSKTLAHDLLEHAEPAHYNPHCDELMALGAVLCHRDDAFYNAYGKDGFADDVANQLYMLVESEAYLDVELPTSSSSEVKERLDYAWEDILDMLTYELNGAPFNKRRLKALAYRYLSKGYNRIRGLELRYRICYRVLFDFVEDMLNRALMPMVDRANIYGSTFTFEIIAYKGYRVLLKENHPTDFKYWSNSDQRYWRQERLMFD